MKAPPAAKMIGTIKTMCSRIFYKSIWMCIFSAILMYDAIRRFMTSICFFCTYYWHPLDGYSSAKEIQYIERCKGELKSVPRHLSVIIGEDKMCPQVLSKIAVYALVADIEYISFYDTKGEFSLDDVQIPRYVSSHKMHNGRFIWSMPSDKKKSGFLRYKNGMEKSIEVVNVSYRQGMPLMVEVIKELYSSRHQAETRDALKDAKELIRLIDETVKRKLILGCSRGTPASLSFISSSRRGFSTVACLGIFSTNFQSANGVMENKIQFSKEIFFIYTFKLLAS